MRQCFSEQVLVYFSWISFCCMEFSMRRSSWSPAILPYGTDQKRSCPTARIKPSPSLSTAWVGSVGFTAKPTSSGRTSKQPSPASSQGQFNDPIRVVAFNSLERWPREVSEDITLEIQTRCASISEHIQDFVANFTGPTRQLAMRFVDPKLCGRKRV
jgi:hypothetical protein